MSERPDDSDGCDKSSPTTGFASMAGNSSCSKKRVDATASRKKYGRAAPMSRVFSLGLFPRKSSASDMLVFGMLPGMRLSLLTNL